MNWKKTKTNIIKMLHNRTNWLLGAVFFTAIFLRFYRLSDFLMFLSDQGRDAIIIKQIVTLEHWPAIGPTTSLGGVFLGPFYYYLVSPFLLLFNFNPVGLAFAVGFYSIIFIYLIYQLIKKELEQNISLLLLFFISFSYILVSQSRFSWNPNLLPYFAFLTLFFFYKFITKPNIYFGLLWGVLFGLSFQLHYLALLLFLPIALFYFYQLKLSKIKIKMIFTGFVVLLSIFVVNLPLVIFDLRHNFINFNNLIKLLTQENFISKMTYLERFNLNLTAFIKNSVGYSKIGEFNLLLFIIIVLLIGIYFFINKKVNLFIKINYINVVLYLAFFTLISSPGHPHYFNNIYLSFYLVLAYIIIISIKQFDPKKQTLILAIFIISFLYLNIPKNSYLLDPKQNQAEYAQKTALFLEKKIDQKPFNIATWPIDFFEDQYLYYLELEGLRPADRSKGEVTEQMFVLCAQKPCLVIDSPSWNINMFGKAKVDKIYKVQDLIIYKLIHEK